MNPEYVKLDGVRLGDFHDEKWLQDKIEEDPSILRLGELEVFQRERKQPTGGRIDFLMLDRGSDTMYEVEVMLGSLNESHIIRAIEYWDVERRRFPTKDHKAVIVAEEITDRFFNVISLMNRSIPIIALKLSTFIIGEKLGIAFTKVLDTYVEPEDEEPAGEQVDRAYWERRSNPQSMSVLDQIIATAKGLGEDASVYLQ